MATEIIQLQELPKSQTIDRLNEWMYQVDIFRAALELALWDKVAAGEQTAEQLAAKEGWDPHGTRMLLDDLCALKLLRKQDNRYRLVPEAEYFLLPAKPTYQGDFLLSEFNWEGNGQLAGAIRSGKRPIHYEATTDDVTNLWIGLYAGSCAVPQSYLEKTDAL